MTTTAARAREPVLRQGDGYVDFCLWPYAPTSAPAPDALAGADLLFAAAALGGALQEHEAIAAALISELGRYRTVWGVKWDGQSLGSELYFYDYSRLARAIPFSRITRVLMPFVSIPDVVDEKLPYFMASVDVPMRADDFPLAANSVDLYVGNPGSSVSSGICYRADATGRELKNFYFFFDRYRDWDDILAKAACSAQVPLPQFNPEIILPSWLAECRVVVIANKRCCDAVYFSGISIDQLIRFFEHFDYPEALITHAKEVRTRLSHLQFDVGFDYRMEVGGMKVLKSGFYNVY